MARPLLVPAFIALISILLIAGVRTQEVESEHEFEYKKGPRGPEHWGELHEEWKACGNGRQQSPIDLVSRNVYMHPNLGVLRRNYRPAKAHIKNRGHDIMVQWPDGAGTIHIDGDSYTLSQCHWHAPAEHTVNGKRHPLEIHLVHQANNYSKIAVVGILYKFGRPDTFLAQLLDEIASIADMEPVQESLGILDPTYIKFGSRKYHRYVGSLTTPPCTEGVIWTIVNKVRTVSREQVRALHTAVHEEYKKNARPIQSTNERAVRLYQPNEKPRHL